MRSWSWPVAALALIALVVGCESSGPADPTVAYQRLSLAQKAVDVGVNETEQLTLSATPLGGSVTWQSTNPAVATVSNGGLVAGRSIGTSKIVAAYGKSSDTATVTVHAAVAKLSVTPDSATVLVGQSMQLSFSALDKSGKTITGLTGSSAKWSSSDPTIATVSPTGLVQGVASGVTAISLTVSGRTSVAFLRVSPLPVDTVVLSPSPTASTNVGSPLTLKATAEDATGKPLSDWIVVWSSSDSSIATVSSTGAVTSYKSGKATITASAGGKQAQTMLIANPAVVASVVIAVNASTIQVGQTTQAVATALDSAGNQISGRGVTWASAKPSVATVSSLGVITGVDTGSAKITATVDGVVGSTTETIGGATVANVSVTLDKSTIPVGSTAQATAVATDASGNVLTGRTVTWASSNTSIATVSNLGVVTAVGTGTVSISGTVDGKTSSATLVATSSVVASVSVSAATTSLAPGQTTQATAVLKDASGAIITAPVTWTSSAPAVATVSSSGLITAVAGGSATITATSGTASGTLNITVSGTAPSSPTSGSVATLPELPRVVPSSRDPYPGRACSTTVSAGGDITGALSAARGGQVVCLVAGATYPPFQLPARASGDTGWIVLRTATSLPAEGTRMKPSTAGSLAKIVQTLNGTEAVNTVPSTYGYFLRGIEITLGPSVTITYPIVTLGDGSSAQNSVSLMPHDLVLSQMYIHGNTTDEVQRCVALNTGAAAIVDSWLSNCHGKGYDTQAIAGWNGTGPYLISNNYLEAAGENIMFGGAAPGAEGLVAYDVTITRNWIRTPIAWQGVWTRKNLLELKVAHRVLIEGNVMDGAWADAQVGYGIAFKSACNGFHNENTEDVTFRNNYVTHIGAGFSISGRESQVGDCQSQYPSERTQRILVENNIVDTINVAPYSGAGRLTQISGVQHAVADLTMRHNSITTTGGVQHMITLDAVAAPACDRFDYQSNVVMEGDYSIFSSMGFGKAALDMWTVPYTFTNNIVVKGSGGPWTYPATTTLVASIADAMSLAAQTGGGPDAAKVAAATQGVVTP